ncbi:M1 family metallopeptidase [Georgenia yuyongxinii]|uniref:M1 family metallopeptidase n=1 Tax=Georgenia yuyongxinii TaxID=2589797 RepID=A0A5B8C615_9MICO|nr:M1 family metallopeptidase [Georgenia yuyongxinii]QDC24602.1 M1 family metallopeptidase [Georgenia yuyongxinii]
MRRRTLSAAVVTALLALSACTGTDAPGGGASGSGAPSRSGADGSSGPVRPGEERPEATASGAASWPAPDPSRPVMDLSFTVATDLRSAVGQERVRFTPDLDVCELVFRAWPNNPSIAAAGNALVMDAVSVDGAPAVAEVSPAGAPEGSPGTLIEVQLPGCVDAATPIDVDLGFTLTFGEDSGERVGVTPEDEVAWFGSAYPMLAWERGVGWARDDAVPVSGETATSEDFELRSLEVTAPSEYDVLGAGELVGTTDGEDPGTTIHRFTAPAVRDVTVTVGRLDVIQYTVGDVTVHVGAPTIGIRSTPQRWAEELAGSVERVSALLGPMPYDDLWVSVLPDTADGVEFPGAVQFRDTNPRRDGWLVTHEVAHMWFYGLVGNNQGRDPWLDESFASFVQVVADDRDRDPAPSGDVPRLVLGDVGRPMSFWAEQFDRPGNAYIQGVYVAGTDALIEARRAVGADAFDDALRSYIRANAHSVATPEDVVEAFADLPEVIEVLKDAGALER